MAGTFKDDMEAGYALSQPSVVLGSPMDGATILPDIRVQVALSMTNRHGLIAGATGTGKTKTLQAMAGQLSLAGVPCLVADIKGDVSGMALPGDATNPNVKGHHGAAGRPGHAPRGAGGASAPMSRRARRGSGRPRQVKGG